MLSRDPTTGDLSCLVACYDECSYVCLDFWPDDDVLYGEFYVAASTPAMGWLGRFGRLAAIWKLLRGREHVMQAIALDRKGAWELRDFLDATLGERGKGGE